MSAPHHLAYCCYSFVPILSKDFLLQLWHFLESPRVSWCGLKSPYYDYGTSLHLIASFTTAIILSPSCQKVSYCGYDTQLHNQQFHGMASSMWRVLPLWSTKGLIIVWFIRPHSLDNLFWLWFHLIKVQSAYFLPKPSSLHTTIVAPHCISYCGLVSSPSC